MSDLVRLAVVLAISVAGTACSGRVPSDGFKDLRYGMTLDELRLRGFDCQPDDYYCGPALGDDGKYTLFGKEASVRVETADGKLVAILVHVDLTSDELIALYRREFGNPKRFTFRSLGGQSERQYWHSGDRAAIAVTLSLIHI